MTEACFNIHNIVKFKIVDKSNFITKKTFGDVLEEYTNYLSENRISDKDLDFTVTIMEKIKPKQCCYILDDKYYIDEGYLYTEDSYKLARWKIELIRNVGRYIANIEPNSVARFFISGFFIDFMVQYTLTKKGYSTVHSSGLSKNDFVYLFSGRGGSGKTSIAINFIQGDKYKFLGDDFIIVHDGYANPYITPLNLFTYNLNPFLLEKLNRKKRISMLFKKSIYNLTGGYAKFFTKINPKKSFPNKIGSKSKISKIFIIIPTNSKKDDFALKRISKAETVERLVYNQMMDSSYFPKYLVQYGFLFPNDELSNYWDTYKKMLLQNLPNTIKFYLIYISSSYQWNKLTEKLKEVMENE